MSIRIPTPFWSFLPGPIFFGSFFILLYQIFYAEGRLGLGSEYLAFMIGAIASAMLFFNAIQLLSIRQFTLAFAMLVCSLGLSGFIFVIYCGNT